MAIDYAHVLRTICTVESGCDYHAQNPHSSASGAYQIVDGTWALYGGYRHAKDAPPAVQDAKAKGMVQRILVGHAWAVWWVPAVWYAGGLGSLHPWSYRPNGGQSIAEYVNHWLQAGGYDVQVGGGIGGAPVTKGAGAKDSKACAKLTKPQFDAMLKALDDATKKNPNIGFPALVALVAAAGVKAGADPVTATACANNIVQSLGGAAQDVAKALGVTPCIHQVGLGPVNFCADVLLGGLKVAAGGVVIAISGLAMLYLLGREVGASAGAGTAIDAAKKVTPGPVKVPLKLASKATGSGTLKRTYRRETPVPKAEQGRRERVYRTKVAARTPKPESRPEPKTERLPDRIDTRKMTPAQRQALGERLRREAR